MGYYMDEYLDAKKKNLKNFKKSIKNKK
jgi:hypothetical protein